MHLFDVLLLPNFLVGGNSMMSTPRFSYLLSSNTLTKLCAIILLCVIGIVMAKFSNIIHGVRTLM